MTTLLTRASEFSMVQSPRSGEGRCESEGLDPVARLGEILPFVLRRYDLWDVPWTDEWDGRVPIPVSSHER